MTLSTGFTRALRRPWVVNQLTQYLRFWPNKQDRRQPVDKTYPGPQENGQPPNGLPAEYE